MKLKELKIDNILAFGEPTTFEFKNSPIFIIGPNGSGKSTIIDALYVLFYRKPIRTHSITQLLADPSKPGILELTFMFKKSVYQVKRVIGKKSYNKQDYLYKDDEIVTQGAQNVTKELEDLIGPEKYWLTLVPQRKLLNILDPPYLKSILYQLFEIDKITIFYKATTKIINKIETQIKTLADQKSQMEDDKNSLLKQFNKNIYNKLSKQLDDLDCEYKSLVNTTFDNQLEELIDKKNEILKDLENYESQLKIYESTKHLKYLLKLDFNKLKPKLQETNLISDNLSENETYNLFKIDIKKVSNLKETLIHMIDQLKQFKALDAKLSLKLNQLYNSYKNYDLQQLISNVKVNIDYEQVKKSSLKIISFLNRSLQLGLDLENDYKEPNDFDFNTIQKFKKVLNTMKDIPDVSEKDKKILRSFRSWDDVELKISTIHSRLKYLANQLTYLHTKSDKVLKKIDRLKIININHIKSFEEFMNLKKILNDLAYVQQYCQSFTEWKTIVTGNVTKDDVNDLQKQLDNVDLQIKELKNQKEITSKKLLSIDTQRKQLQSDLSKLKSYKIQLDTLNQQLNKLNERINLHSLKLKTVASYKDILSNLETIIIQRFRTTLPALVKEVLDKFGFDINVQITSEFDLVAVVNNQQVSPNLLSGAQQSVLALAIRYVLSRIIDSPLPIILDEVTEGFDVNRIDILKGFINSLATSQQTIIVSHDIRIISDGVGDIIQLGES